MIAVLRRVGVRVSRSLARAPALRILEAVAADGKIQRWRGSVPALEHHLRQRGAGVYLLGLSHHIAFAVVHDDQVSLMHASRRAGQVIAEHLSTSTAVLSSRRSEIFVAALALTE